MPQMKQFSFITIMLAFLLLIGGCSYNGSVLSDSSATEMYSNALALYAGGDTDSATYQMALYLEMEQSDADAMRLLARWYDELGKKNYADKYIRLAARYTELPSDADIVLSGEADSVLVTSHVAAFSVDILPLAVRSDSVTITVVGKNLFSGVYEKDSYLGKETAGWRTSEWFMVDADTKTLTISGGFNRAIWQFELSDGERVLVGDESKTYRVSNSNLVKNLATATAEIPEGAVQCRIAYAYEPDETTDTLDERVQIEYGLFPSDYEEYRFSQIEIPNLDEGEFIRYDKGVWTLSSEEIGTTIELTDFDLRKGDTISVSSSLAAIVKVDIDEAAIDTEGIYGVTWSNEDTSILLERTDDAVGLSFNYLSGDSWAGPYQNDFDNIYPWCEIKLCAIDALGNITYEGETGFATDGSAGNVFVEIPKHYVCRKVLDGVEYVAISATPQEGFELDPSFQRESGEVDHIYVAAYLTSLISGSATSISGAIPATNESLAELRTYMDSSNNSNFGNYSEIDYFAILTIQRLFLIETGVRNSQVFWQGETSKSYLSMSATQQYALYDASRSNTIAIVDSTLNQRFQVGDAVCVCTYEQFFGDRKYDTYYSRVVTDIENVDNELWISFDGEPLDIIADETQIAHVSDVNGKTDSLKYHSGTKSEIEDGLSAFRYRYLENIWGNGFICVDGVEVTGRTICVTYPDGRVAELSYELGLQQESPGQTDNVDYGLMNISEFGYDESNPLVMLPVAVGASVSTAFGDTLYTGFRDGWDEKTVTLLWGGTWDLRTSCGLFCYRVLSTDTDNFRENASRIMFWPLIS